jgi:catechol 2,3-dioxygenase-like lactoylglutathione lyase family enzyme
VSLNILLNIDVPDIGKGAAFYTAALGLRIGRRFDGGFVELLGADAPIYLLEKGAGDEYRPDRR